ncbi:hypothetical protein PAPYR_2116 [Paratrimastix pyriformis]|uniref:Uncharacterized protein n=1 Tax=Paratrimastix pyriformis TaxID=342808 RepID=A0ABQ8URR0_9EUKA|nr:hypothetical protein PAPYR_2116 [Paratrimastix pyriformis]
MAKSLIKFSLNRAVKPKETVVPAGDVQPRTMPTFQMEQQTGRQQKQRHIPFRVISLGPKEPVPPPPQKQVFTPYSQIQQPRDLTLEDEDEDEDQESHVRQRQAHLRALQKPSAMLLVDYPQPTQHRALPPELVWALRRAQKRKQAQTACPPEEEEDDDDALERSPSPPQAPPPPSPPTPAPPTEPAPAPPPLEHPPGDLHTRHKRQRTPASLAARKARRLQRKSKPHQPPPPPPPPPPPGDRAARRKQRKERRRIAARVRQGKPPLPKPTSVFRGPAMITPYAVFTLPGLAPRHGCHCNGRVGRTELWMRQAPSFSAASSPPGASPPPDLPPAPAGRAVVHAMSHPPQSFETVVWRLAPAAFRPVIAH